MQADNCIIKEYKYKVDSDFEQSKEAENEPAWRTKEIG